MNAPGSPSSPLQMTYLALSALCPGDRPLAPGGKARAAAAAKARIRDRGDHLFRRRCLQAGGQRLVAVAGEVVVDVQRIDLAAVLEDDALLLAEIRGRGARASIEPEFVQVRLVVVARDPFRERLGPPACPGAEPTGTDVLPRNLARRLGGHVAVERDRVRPARPLPPAARGGTCRCSRRS